MNFLERYLWKSVLTSILITWLSLALLDRFFAFLSEMGDVSPETQYGNLQALYYTLMGTPKILYDYFPTVTLIGSLLGLGNLAANSELTAMRAAGVSIRQIVVMTLKLGLALAIVVFVLGEWIAPRTELAASSFKLRMQQKQLAIGNQGVWVKDGNRILNIATLWSANKMEGVSIYAINPEEGRIESITHAARAERDADGWMLYDLKRQTIRADGVTQEVLEQVHQTDLIPEQVMSIAAVKPNQLAASQLADYIQHQHDNALSSAHFEQAFWQHFTTPLSTLVMLVLAAPFVFGFQRNSGAGQRIFIGILIGIGFFLFNRTLGSIGIVYGVPPLLSATLPLLIFLVGGLWMLRGIR
ncbi:LPS export ABC transporter permease LptG [Thiothrix fructosivorans]|uniref:LPS export ABC transporter permease LptG n=1 Tax=Thiothrix fructosivorans TaxID=111770 RepID=A0A8B0SCL7_9GAMM|nr:LPS export ABC transporter permease LptG [Thiothrix fructosivorans]MBO0614234.1 LPS export ABC transporter permease LptG [Thiothrix fructosivorans]QTX09086.1 LPS export ABC transporter permease LptG [Thiothrix fructosivorans]